MEWSLSLPSRERGLKSNIYNLTTQENGVAPFAGAWIEIASIPTDDRDAASLPSRERGLK